MKKSIAALAIALALTGTLASCGADRNSNGTTGSTGGSSVSGTGSGSAGQVARRYDNATIYNGRTYFDDGRYTANSNGRVYDRDDNTASQDLTRDARDIVRDAGDALGDVGRGIGNAARDITGMGNSNYSGTPSWEPDSSAVRY